MIRTKTIDLRHISTTKAKKVIKRLYLFKKIKGYQFNLKFLLPGKIIKKKKSSKIQKCPYCLSHLEENGYDLVCSNDKMDEIVQELEEYVGKYKEKAPLFISKRAHGYYHDYLIDKEDLKCQYKKKEEESRFL